MTVQILNDDSPNGAIVTDFELVVFATRGCVRDYQIATAIDGNPRKGGMQIGDKDILLPVGIARDEIRGAAVKCDHATIYVNRTFVRASALIITASSAGTVNAD